MIVDNGMGVVVVDEEMVLKKKKKDGSVEDGKKSFAWMIHPEKVEKFFAETFEKRPLHIKRKNQYYKHIFSTKAFDEILRHQVFRHFTQLSNFSIRFFGKIIDWKID